MAVSSRILASSSECTLVFGKVQSFGAIKGFYSSNLTGLESRWLLVSVVSCRQHAASQTLLELSTC